MRLPVPFIQLPLSYDAEALAAEVAAVDAREWRPHPNALPGNSMLPLIAVGGDADDEGFAGPMQPTSLLRGCPYLMQVLASFGATLGRTRLMRLAGQAEVARHVDQGYYWAERVRVHVPIVTQPTVRFECGDAAINMGAGECWIFDTWRQHRVLNDADLPRIHLVADTMGAGEFWAQVGRGRAPGKPQPEGAWQPRHVAPRKGVAPELMCEAVNVPEVMSPWELNAHLGMLIADALPHPELGRVQHHAQRFAQTWRGLWARYGEARDGRPHYQRALGQFIEEVQGPGQAVRLRNEITWFSAMMTLVAKVAVRHEGAAAADQGEYGIADRA